MPQRPYIVGNWKMHGTRAMLSEARAIDRAAQRHMKVEVAIAPPYTLIHPVHREAEQIGVGAQDCHHEDGGAHTGDISAVMVADAGAKFVILGHSERRQNHGESDAIIRAKVEAALAAGLRIILCCGESDKTREAGKAVSFVKRQLKASLPVGHEALAAASERLTIAYEPIWAIGTGNSATVEDIAEMHREIRTLLVELFGEEQGAEVRILYGGSVKPENAGQILSAPEVGGALVGGASLTVDSFMSIALAAAEADEG
ncbi:triose-phosphate isomerase [Erythrobacter sp. HL-111]|uniref:triose-phosphate isomerase n=1 Tax=Erythrobacter sp. HL-111 TaxID=1798193 RepID=UPI0006D9F1B8|nr:triose-phosphate isomerase [Erythrobacter sp. HL-111]KPP96648.1 MAG: triosephosphate isomerase (TIM) TpiA [Erythrobacteraceae bacterium HL-111]SDR99295.1 triosephosphate isomerase [Erythrobacter sp. HL-111]